jgi:anthranilate synthase component 2
MKLLIIDNYDSFTWNLYHYCLDHAEEVVVWRNDAFELADVEAFDRIVLSPGPGLPEESGLLMQVLQRYATQKPILGVCLGLQAIAEHFGGKLTNLPEVLHGVATPCFIKDYTDPLFAGIASPFMAAHYHSWVAHEDTLPSTLHITARSEAGHIMALRHTNLPIWGVQFHPESVLTPCGRQLLANWFTLGK